MKKLFPQIWLTCVLYGLVGVVGAALFSTEEAARTAPSLLFLGLFGTLIGRLCVFLGKIMKSPHERSFKVDLIVSGLIGALLTALFPRYPEQSFLVNWLLQSVAFVIVFRLFTLGRRQWVEEEKSKGGPLK